MADVETLVIDGAVAVGTLGATILTVYQLRRDSREKVARELADRVYVPMRKRARAWQDPESLPIGDLWKNLQEDTPYLTMKVPKDLRELFDAGERIERDTWPYIMPITQYIQSQSPGENTAIRFTKGGQFLGEVYPINIWKSGKTFTQY